MKPGFKPMLACSEELDVSQIRFPVYASFKLDGFRGLVLDGKLVSRNLKPIPNTYVSALFSHPALNGWDGELIVGSPTAKNAKGDSIVFRTTSSALTTEAFRPDVTFYVFDNFEAKGGFNERLATLANHPGIKVVEQKRVNNSAELLAYEAVALDAGYEGLIIRSIDGPYKFGRSTLKEGTLLKLKRFFDSEAVVLGMDEEESNNNAAVKDALGHTKRSSHKAGKAGKGRMGALRVRDVNPNSPVHGVEFSVGSGFDLADREWFWENQDAIIGKLVIKCKFFLNGMVDKPKFPTYLGVRPALDR